MNGTQTFILECGRINSVGVEGSGEDFDNKSSWVNQTAPILLKQGDTVSLQNVLINVGGADTNAIQFQGVQTTPNQAIQDNFTLMKIGFYLNHNGIYTTALPLKYQSASTPTNVKTLEIDTSTNGNYDGITNRTNNSLGKFQNYQYFNGRDTTDQLLPTDQRISRIDAIESCNPFNPMNSGKFSIISPHYVGWCRANNGHAHAANQVNHIALLEQDIPILLPQGFISPTGIADLITNIFSFTKQDVRNPQERFTATANKFKQDETDHADKVKLKQYALNGYTYKTINANLQGTGHKVYGCMGVDEPYQWLYGTNIIANIEVDNYTQNKDYFNSGNNPDDQRVDYPSIIWQRFIGNNPTDFDLGIEGRTGQYSNYSPFKTTEKAGGSTNLIEARGLSLTYSNFNDYYINLATIDTDGAYFIQNSLTEYTLVKQSVFGSQFMNNNKQLGFYVDNDDPAVSRIIGYRRFPSLFGNWEANEHQIFKDTAKGQPGGSNPYTFSGAGAGQPSETFFSYDATDKRTIFFGSTVGGLGFSGQVVISNILTADSGGIIEGGDYKITLKTEIEPTYSYSDGQVILASNGGIGLATQTLNTDNTHTFTFTATADNLASNAITLAINYTNVACVIKVSEISILRDNLDQNDTYLLNNVFNNNTSQQDDNKIFSFVRSAGISNVQTTISGATTLTNYNRTYTLLTSGLIGNLVGSTFSLITSPDSSDGVYLNDEDTTYSFWIFKYNNNWNAVRLTKYAGGIPTNGKVIGDTTQAISVIKTAPRAGQQYYDFTGGNIWSSSIGKVKYNLATGNGATGWKDYTPPSLEFYNFTDVVGTSSSGFAYDHTYQRTSPASSNIVYLATTAGTSGLQGTARFDGGGASAIWNGTWTLTTSGGVDGFGDLTLNGTVVSSGATFTAVFNAQAALTLATGSHSFTNHIADPLPVIDTDKQYFASVIVNGITYYLGANPDPPADPADRDTNLEGKRGRLIYSTDGGVSFTTSTWNWNGTNLIDMNGDGGNIALTTSSPGLITLSNVFQYPINQTISGFKAPIDGRQYGNNTGDEGTTASALVSESTEYLGFNDATDPTSKLNVNEGFVYSNFTDSFASNNGKKWKLELQAVNKYVLKITDATDGVVLLTLENNGDGFLDYGYTLMEMNKKTDTQIEGLSATGIVFDGLTKQGFITDAVADTTGDQVGPATSGTAGADYRIYENGTGTFVDEGTFRTYTGANLDSSIADMKKSQLLMTNIVMTTDSLDKIKDFYRNNEVYSGTQETRTSIANDVRNFYCQMDLGRSNDSSVDTTNTNSSDNTTGRTPYIAHYMRDQGIMGKDNGNLDNANMGCICPMFHHSGEIENRLKVFTGYQDGYESRIIAQGMYGNLIGNDTNFCYGNSLNSDEFEDQYNELYLKCKNENIGVIPFINKKTGQLMVGFELFENTNDIQKIQNLSYFVYSPTTIDHKYITFFNNDAPSIKTSGGGDYNYTSEIEDQMNFIQVGATQPTMEYNTDLNKFTLRYFHTPTFFNKETGTETNIGQEIAKIFDNASNVIFKDFCFQLNPEELADDNRRNIGVNDSQSGIFIKDVYFQKVQSNNFQISSDTDAFSVLMTRDNFYNTLWFKLGFSYFDLRPIRFKQDAFYENRFNNFTYNNIGDQFRDQGIVPFTTNSLFNINFAPLLNIFSVNSGEVGTENPNKGTEIYGLGFNNNVSADVQVESDSLFPTSIPVNISSGYYRIYTDLPIDTLTYTSGGASLAVIGNALLNYASSQQFFFSYGMDYGATITKDVLINNVKIEIRDDRGALVKGLGDRSLVVLKITRAIQLTEPPPDPSIKELQDIEEDLEELVKETKEDNLKDDLKEADNEINQVGIGDSAGVETKRTGQIDTPEEINAFVDNFNIQMIQNLVSRTLVRVSDDNKDVGKRLATGIATYFLRKDNKKEFNRITNDLFNEGIDATLQKPYVAKFVDSMNKFYINVDGKALKGARRQPEIANITDQGALILYDEISKAIQDKPNIKIGALSAILFESINNLFGTDDIKVFNEDDPGIVEAKVGKEEDLDIKDFEVKELEARGFKDSKKGELKKLFLDYGSLENYLKLYGFTKVGGATEAQIKQAFEEIEKSGADLGTLKALYKDAGKFLLQDNPLLFSRTLTRMNNLIEDIIGGRLYDKFNAILEENENTQALTGTGVRNPQKRLRRQAKEVREAKGMEGEDVDAPEAPAPKTPRKRRTKKQMEEARSMESEDKPKTDARTKARRRIIAAEGAEDSPLRTRGREILRQRAEGGASK